MLALATDDAPTDDTTFSRSTSASRDDDAPSRSRLPRAGAPFKFFRGELERPVEPSHARARARDARDVRPRPRARARSRQKFSRRTRASRARATRRAMASEPSTPRRLRVDRADDGAEDAAAPSPMRVRPYRAPWSRENMETRSEAAPGRRTGRWRVAEGQRRAVCRAVLRDELALACVARACATPSDVGGRTFGIDRARERCGVGKNGRLGGGRALGGGTRTEPCENAAARTRYQGDWLDVGIESGSGRPMFEYLERWRAAPFEPYSGARKHCVYAACVGGAANEATRAGVAATMKEISGEYEACGLGTHRSALEDDASGLFDSGKDDGSAMERYARSLGAAATQLSEIGATRPVMCVLYVLIPDEFSDTDALTILALASHVAGAATAAVERCFLSVTVQALPVAWCTNMYSCSSTGARSMAFTIFMKLARPTITRGKALPNDDLNDRPTSGTNVERTGGRHGVCGASVIGRRMPHPLFRTPETATERRAPSFPAHEPLYALTPPSEEKLASSTMRGLHCSYIIVAARWVVASWCDSYGEFFNLEAEPFENERDVEKNGLEWLIERTSALSEQLAFAYGAKSSMKFKFARVVVCRLGECSQRERDALDAACSSAAPPLDRDFLTRVEMTCLEPDVTPVHISAVAPRSAKDVTFIKDVDAQTSAIKVYAIPPCSQDSCAVAFNADASSTLLRALHDVDVETLEALSELYCARLSQLGMMCLNENAVNEYGNLRAPLPYHAEVCVRFASVLQALEVNS